MATISRNQAVQKKRKFSRHFDWMPRPKLKQGYYDGGFVQDTAAPTGGTPPTNPATPAPATATAPQSAPLGQVPALRSTAMAPIPLTSMTQTAAQPATAVQPTGDENLPGSGGAPSGVTPRDYQAALARAAADKKELAGIEAARNTESLKNRATMPVDLSGGIGQAMASAAGRNAARRALTGGTVAFNISRPALAKPTDLVSQAASLGYQGGINPGYTNVNATSLLENSPRPSLYYSRGTARVLGPRGIDKVDAKLTAGEAVLPVETVETLGRENIEELIRATTGKEPKNSLRSGGRYANGVVDDEQLIRLDVARQAAYANADGDAVGVNVAPRISRRVNTVADREDATQGAAMQAVNPAILETRPSATRAATTSSMQSGTPAQRPTQATTPTPPLTDMETYAGQLERNRAADAALSVVDRMVGYGGSVEPPKRPDPAMPFGDRVNGFSAADMESINARINSLKNNPQAMEAFNRAQGLNRTGIVIERDPSGTLTMRSDPNAKPRIYRGADGKDTTNWSDTEDYKQGVARAQADKAELAKIENANKREALMRQATTSTPGSMQEMVQGRLDRAGARSELARLNQQEQVAQQQDFRNRSQAEIERHNRSQEDIQARLADIRERYGFGADTAMVKNIDFLVKNGIARNPGEAFDRLRTAMGKSDEDAILSLAGSLMRSSGYFGKKGYERAVSDATAMVQGVRGKGQAADGAAGTGTPPPGAGRGAYNVRGKSFTDADIEATAAKYGMTSAEVKQRLGIR